MEISIKRDGLTLRGDLIKPEGIDKCPVVIIFHGFMADRGQDKDSMFCKIADACVKKGIAAVKFDFAGSGESDGEFVDMSILSELLDASKIVQYVRSLPFVTDIYIAGHSMGALVGGMTAGYYRDIIKKLVMLSPAASMKDDANAGDCFGLPYDAVNVPDYIVTRDINKTEYKTGGFLFRTVKTLPIYETTSRFTGKTLIIHGTADEAVRVIGSQRYKDCMANCELALYEGENHGLCDHSLDEIVERVADFLSKD